MSVKRSRPPKGGSGVSRPNPRDIRREDVPPFVDLTRGETPYAEVEPVGWMTWSISIRHGMLTWGVNGGSFPRFGTREMAERQAKILLARYERQLKRREDRKARTFRVD